MFETILSVVIFNCAYNNDETVTRTWLRLSGAESDETVTRTWLRSRGAERKYYQICAFIISNTH